MTVTLAGAPPAPFSRPARGATAGPVRADEDGEDDDALEPLLARGCGVGRQGRVPVRGRLEWRRGPDLERRQQDDVGAGGRGRKGCEAQREEQEEADRRQRRGLVRRACYTRRR